MTSVKVPPPTKLAHIALQTAQLPQMRTFYTTILGAHVVHEDALLCLLAYDDEHHRIALICIPSLQPKPQIPTCGLQHIAFTYASLKELLESWEARRKCGIEPVMCVNHGPTTSLYYKDPDGNKVEMQVDNFETVEEANENIQGKAYRENPIGVEFRPEELMKRLRAGEGEKEVKMRNEKLGRELDESALGVLL